MTDEQIIELYWQRDEAAIHETDARYHGFCYAIAWRLLRLVEDAEECVNDTWYRAWNLMPDQRPTVLSAFLGRITRSISIDRIRAKNRRRRGGGEATLALDELEECIPGGTDPERALEEKELEKAIGKFVSHLPYTEKMIFTLRYWYVAPIGEIAERLHFSNGKVKSILFRTRRKLRIYLQEEELC